jgi:hypothetical protein
VRIDVHNHAVPERTLELIAGNRTYGTLTGRRWRGEAHADFEISEWFVDPGAKVAQLEANELTESFVLPSSRVALEEVELVGSGKELLAGGHEQ